MQPSRQKILTFIAALLLWTCASHGEYELTSPSASWQKILETKASFQGTASLHDFLQFIFKDSNANFVFTPRSKPEFHITTSFYDLTLEEILKAISRNPSVRVFWGYSEGPSNPHRIEISTGSIDLMSKEIDMSRYPTQVTLLPKFSPSTNSDPK
jgi:hypothetical protein